MSPFSFLLLLSGKMRSKNTSDPESSASLPSAPRVPGSPPQMPKALWQLQKTRGISESRKSSSLPALGQRGKRIKAIQSPLLSETGSRVLYVAASSLDLCCKHSEKIYLSYLFSWALPRCECNYLAQVNLPRSHLKRNIILRYSLEHVWRARQRELFLNDLKSHSST